MSSYLSRRRQAGKGSRHFSGGQSCSLEMLESRTLLSGNTLAWSTYVGGSGRELTQGFAYAPSGQIVATDAAGNVYVTYRTGSPDVGINGYYNTNDGHDGVVAKFRPDGTLAWSSYLGISGQIQDVSAIATDPAGNVYVVGTIGLGSRNDFIRGGFDTSLNGQTDGFVVKINANGSFAWSSYLGGDSYAMDAAYGVTTDLAGNVFVTGQTSAHWSTPGFDMTPDKDDPDAFVAKITPTGALAWCSRVGGSGGGETGCGIDTDASGNIYVVGSTFHPELVNWTQGGFDTAMSGDEGFIVRINADGTLGWSSLIGGYVNDEATAIDVDPFGNLYVVGNTEGDPNWVRGGFDLTGPARLSPVSDGFVAKITGDGALIWSSFLGGSDTDEGNGIATDHLGNVFITGTTQSTDMGFNGFDMVKDGTFSSDAFVTMIDPAGALVSTSYLGTGANGYAVATDVAGNAYVFGITGGEGWTTGGFDTSFNGGYLDMFLAKVNEVVAPAVKSTVVNGNAVQRSMVRTVNVTFDEGVEITDGGLALLNRSGKVVPNVKVNATPSADKKSWAVTFSGTAVVNGSLPDGIFSLVALPAKVQDLVGNQMPAGAITRFHRLFGDADGDRDVDSRDLALFRQSLNRPSAYRSIFDFNGDSKIDLTDYRQLQRRLVVRL